ncbi:hypothetical protein SAMN05661010_01004 [Modicisalibacter muralis]|uniref:Uncharacterized protein n=1 Tax=Modicisalibacter muralis TaxID=119000 RepID=A0A1G9I254_9GAMM|nr:hypothetical protein [Halomonas muralis]SDL18893.1 hypothetical protein SAMN05661010_01004 [Halomonas muralis]
MSYGLLDLPAPLFDGIDAAFATVLPPTARLVVWALIGAVVSMLLYYFLTPQKRIGIAKQKAADARRRLNDFDGEFSEAGSLIGDQFKTSFRHIGLVLPGTILASLPVLCLLIWLEATYGNAYPPPNQTPTITTQPESVQTRWVAPSEPGGVPHVQVLGSNGEVSSDFELVSPVPVIHERQWWNWLIGNPAGYLPEDGRVERINIELPESRYLEIGPSWMHSWLFVFFPVLVIVSLLIHRFSRIK